MDFNKFIEKAKIEQEMAVKIKQLENNRPVGIPVAQEKKYIQTNSILKFSGMPPHIFNPFHRRDLLTGQVLKSFQELFRDERASFATVRDKLLA